MKALLFTILVIIFNYTYSQNIKLYDTKLQVLDYAYKHKLFCDTLIKEKNIIMFHDETCNFQFKFNEFNKLISIFIFSNNKIETSEFLNFEIPYNSIFNQKKNRFETILIEK